MSPPFLLGHPVSSVNYIGKQIIIKIITLVCSSVLLIYKPHSEQLNKNTFSYLVGIDGVQKETDNFNKQLRFTRKSH